MIDWRLQGQESFLQGIELVRDTYKPYSADWDHDHCEFCQRKFAVQDGDFTEGYSTKDQYHWICPECFDDFKDMFKWTVVQVK